MRVGLVLGAGGVMGGAWHVGALDALAQETGWDPGSAEVVIGTSAGSMIGSLLTSGVTPWFMRAHSNGEDFEGLVDEQGRPAAEADRSGGAIFRPHLGLPVPGPGSLTLIARTLRDMRRFPPTAIGAGWLPRGLVSTEPLKDIIRRVVPSGWSPHPDMWVVTCDYGTGKRVAFGREGAPPADLADAVAASCAIPGFYRPVKINGRNYVDGGVCSTSNADLLRGRGLDLVICLSPLSSRSGVAKRLRHEARKLLDEGTDVVYFEPRGEIRGNLMSRSKRNEVMEAAFTNVAERVKELHPHLRGLPQGHPSAVGRPAGPPEQWTSLRQDVLAARLAA